MTETVLEEKVSGLEKIMMELAYESINYPDLMRCNIDFSDPDISYPALLSDFISIPDDAVFKKNDQRG